MATNDYWTWNGGYPHGSPYVNIAADPAGDTDEEIAYTVSYTYTVPGQQWYINADGNLYQASKEEMEWDP